MDVREIPYDVGVIVGRFQVDRLHHVHRDLLDTVFKRHRRVLVFLGETVVVSAENPLSFQARRQMLHESYPNVEVYSIMDRDSDEQWSRNLDAAIRERKSPIQTVVLYGGRDSFLNSYHGEFDTRELTSEEVTSGTYVRSVIANSTTINSADFRAGVIWAQANRFPQSHPVVDFAIVNTTSNKVLLGKRAGNTKWQFPGGFVDITDKSLEHAVIREAHEETGVWLSLPRVEYLGSLEVANDYRYRSLAHQRILTSMFIAYCDPSDMKAQAGDDIHAVAWFSIDDFDPTVVIDEHQPQLDLFLRKVGLRA